MKHFFLKFLREDDATTAVEYAVMLALIIGSIIVTIGSVGGATGGMWGGIDADLVSAGFGS